jgi:undecaprenyl-diphosphatase
MQIWTLSKYRLYSFWQELRRVEPLVLIVSALTIAGVWSFVVLAEQVVEGDTSSIDRRLLLALRNPQDITDPLGPPWVEEMMRDFTALGGSAILILLVAGVVIWLLLVRRYETAVLVIVAVVGGNLLSISLKNLFDRPRPDLVPHGSIVYMASFPSGHSILAAVTYLTLGALVARVQPRRRIKVYILVLAIFITILVGVSRVYLGVHWPSDVVAGWSVGFAWALFCWLAARWFQHARQQP